MGGRGGMVGANGPQEQTLAPALRSGASASVAGHGFRFGANGESLVDAELP